VLAATAEDAVAEERVLVNRTFDRFDDVE